MSVQLAATGQPDVYITGKPSVTYFSAVYLRHSPFLKQTYEVPFDNQPVRTGFTSVCTVPVNGDIVTDITLKTVLPVLNAPASLTTFYWPTPSTNVYICANYGTVSSYFTGYGSNLIQTTATTTTTTMNGYTGGKWWWANDIFGFGLLILPGPDGFNNLFEIIYNPSSLSFTITCPPTVTGLQTPPFVYYLNPGGGTPNPNYSPVPTAIYFPDTTSANFFGFTSANILYPLVNGAVTGGNLSTTGWIYGNGIVPGTNYYDSVGVQLIKEARLTVGAHIISTINGSYIDLMNDMDVPYENQVGLTQLVGKNDSTSVVLPRYLYTKLNFGLKNLPICCLGRHDVMIEIDFNPVLSAQLTTSNVITSSFIIEYATVGIAERDWLTKSRQAYVYESMLTRTVPIKLGDNFVTLNGYFRFPVKELYITLQTPANSTNYIYSDSLANMVILFNDQELINYSSNFFKIIEPFETKNTMPTRVVYVYAFNGPVNFSRMSDIKLKLTTTTGSLVGDIYAKTLNVLVIENGMGSLAFA
jgi:hypothetical protein